MFTRTVKKEKYHKALINVLDEIEPLLNTKNIAYSVDGSTLITERILTMLRHMQDGDSLSKLIKSQILEAALKTENAGPNSTDMFLSFLNQAIRTILKSELKIEEIKKELDKEYEDYKVVLAKTYEKPSWTDIEECVLGVSKNKKISNMVLESVKLAGLEGNILPLWRPGDYGIELVSGYNFPVTTYPIFTDADKGRWERKEVRCLVVDGVIEKESEIHQVFMEAAKSNSSMLIVTRGYGEEVIGTIAANKTLDICPIRVPWEVESINLIADISITGGSYIVSTLKGDTLSSVKFDDLPIVEHVICTRKNLNIINQTTNSAVSNHLNDLIQRREEAASEEMQEMITKRIQALNSHTVHLYLGSKNEQERMKELEAVDFGLRVVKSILDKGTIIPGKTLIELSEFSEKRPTLSVLSAIHHGISLAKSLSFVDAAVVTDFQALP